MRSTPMCRANTHSNAVASTTRGTIEATGGDESAVFAATSPAQAASPTSASHGRAVPRSRMVERNAEYSSCSRDVTVLPLTGARFAPDKRVIGAIAYCAAWHNCWWCSGVGSAVRKTGLDGSDNCLARQQLSATLTSHFPLTQFVRGTRVSRTRIFWAGPLALLCLVSFGSGPADAQTRDTSANRSSAKKS